MVVQRLRSTGIRVTAVATLGLVAVGWPRAGLAVFEIDGSGPRQRGCATAMALGPMGTPPAGCLVWPAGCEGASGEIEIYGFRPFGLRQVDFAAISARVARGGALREVGVSCQRLQAAGYHEEVYSVRVSLAAGPVLVRPAVRFGMTGVEDMFADWALLADCRASVLVHQCLRAEVGLDNPFGLGLHRGGSRAPTALDAGLAVAASDQLTFGMELAKSNGFPTCLATGIELESRGGLRLRAGVKTCPREMALGVGLSRGTIAVEVASSINLDLGATHEAGVRLLWR
jgi:hypothetical protein